MGNLDILELDEERVPKERPPSFTPIDIGASGNIVIERIEGISRFGIFGKSKVLSPRSVTFMSRVESLRVTDNILTSGQREERRLLPLASTHPEEIYRYWNYARLAKGDVLALGVGLGLFVKMAHCKRLLAVEPDENIRILLSSNVLSSNPFYEGMIHGTLEQAANDSFINRVRYNFIFLDPIPYTGSPVNALDPEQLPEFNRMIGIARKMLTHGGKIAVKGYRSLVQKYQERCQELVLFALATDDSAERWVEKSAGQMSQMCFKWARKNSKRVGRDHKFVNAWARKTAMTVT